VVDTSFYRRRDSRARIPPTTPSRSLFREVNERIRDVNVAFGLGPGSYELVCECAHCDCMQRLPVPGDVYDKVRLAAGRFLVANGHEYDDRIVAGAELFSVVATEPVEAEALTATG
jgi:hypothetical protein